MPRFLVFSSLCLALLVPVSRAYATSTQDNVCPRYKAGSALVEPKDLFSVGGVLRVTFDYKTRVDADGNTLYCFMTPDGTQSPTLHVHPGDELVITLKNDLPAPSPNTNAMKGMNGMKMDPVVVSGEAWAN